MKRIVILGGGYGGVLAAKKLANSFHNAHDVKITLIDKKPYHTLLTELHEVAAGRVAEGSIKVEFHKIFAERNVEVVLDYITEIDFEQNLLRSADDVYKYDYLVVGTGCKPSFFGIPGAKEHAYTLWSYEDAVLLKERIREMFRQAAKEQDPKVRRQLLSFVVAGAGFTGVEMIGELGEYKEELCKEFYIDPAEVQLHLVDMVDDILPILPQKLRDKARKRLGRLGIDIITKAKIVEVTGQSVCLEGRDPIKAETIIWTAGVEGSDLMGNINIEQKGRGRIVTNDKLESVEHKNVYVVGDNIFYIPEDHQSPVPQMVENAEHSAALVAHYIYADIRNREKKRYKPTFHGTMVCIGGRYGVAYVGIPKMMIMLSGFLAMFCKHLINIVYLVQICGFNKIFAYLQHEFFHVPNRRSFVGGHLEKRTHSFWLLPLRVFVGAMWLTQGLGKIGKVLSDPSNIFLIPAPSTDGTSGASAAESISGASQAAWEGAQGLPVPEWISRMTDASMNMFFYTADGDFTKLASVFQAGMVIGEIVFGLLLIVGLFTTISSLVTLLMGCMIWASGTASFEMLWYMAAAIALAGGTGGAFGLDYYLRPPLKKAWKNNRFVKRWYLYTD